MVEVPAGAIAGSVIQAPTPGGLMLQVAVPPGARPGQRISVQYSSPPDTSASLRASQHLRGLKSGDRVKIEGSASRHDGRVGIIARYTEKHGVFVVDLDNIHGVLGGEKVSIKPENLSIQAAGATDEMRAPGVPSTDETTVSTVSCGSCLKHNKVQSA